MIKMLRTKVGFYKRGLVGFWQNKFEPYVEVPQNIEKFVFGESAEGREIFCYKIGQGAVPVLFVSSIHGNEVGTIKLAHRLLNWLNQDSGKYNQFSFYIIPVFNPDGHHIAKHNPNYFGGGRKGRFNGHNVDLNRNFPTPSFQSNSFWGIGKNYSEKINVFCGEFGGSEPEIQGLIKFIQEKQIKFYFAFHSMGAGVMGNNQPLAQELMDVFAKASGYTKEGLGDWVNLKQTGTAKEWCDIHSINYLEIEGRYRYSPDWPAHKKGIEAVLEKLANTSTGG